MKSPVTTKDQNLITELEQCQKRLEASLARQDWQSAQKYVADRHKLLEQLAEELDRLKSSNNKADTLAARARIKIALEKLQEENELCLDKIKHQVTASKDRIIGIKKGRHALGLYRKPDTRQPRFFNKVG